MTRHSCLALLACLMLASGPAWANSFASSASSAGSASVGSVSDSFRGSSNSSTGGDKVADGDYRILQIANAPDRTGITRVTLRAADDTDAQPDFTLDLPQDTFERQQLSRGDLVRATQRVYGYEFARSDTREPFFLVLADDWYGDLDPRPVGL